MKKDSVLIKHKTLLKSLKNKKYQLLNPITNFTNRENLLKNYIYFI